MRPYALLQVLMVTATFAGAHGLRAAATGTPAARFWEQALPGSAMPEAIAELVQEGIDRSPLKERYTAPLFLPSACLGYSYKISVCNGERLNAEEKVTGLFFHEAQVRTGSAAMKVSLPPASVQPILPSHVADKVPFSNTSAVLAAFAIPPRSDEAAQVRDTLRGCKAPPLAGEEKACATSLEATVRAATTMMAATGGGRRVWAAASELPRDGLPRREYVVTAVTALDGDRHVACHDEPFPYAVFQCHMAGPSTTKAYMMTLSGGGTTVTMAALCHRDTSSWNPAHPAFEMLGTKPGGEPVCHFMPYANLVFGTKI